MSAVRLDPERARDWFAASRVARMASVDGAEPHLVPITFGTLGDLVATAVDHKPKSTKRLRRLRIIEANPNVALLTDHYAEEWSALWWVRADGTAEITTTGECPDLVEALREKYPQYREQPPSGELIVVRVRRWRGWAASDA